jgi:hypothetical protein
MDANRAGGGYSIVMGILSCQQGPEGGPQFQIIGLAAELAPGRVKRCEMPFNRMIYALLHATWRIAHERPATAFFRVDVPEGPDSI